MDFLASLPTYEHDQASRSVWGALKQTVGALDGICYYQHPVIAWAGSVPDLTLLAKGYEPLAVRCLNYDIDELTAIEQNRWIINGSQIDSPFVELDDYITGLKEKFERERMLRRKFNPGAALALPLISRTDFEDKFGQPTAEVGMIWRDLDVADVLESSSQRFSEPEWRLAKSVFQGINPLNRGIGELPKTAPTMGEAIKILEKEIALLDEEQHKVAIQIAPGPQRIRGLAGTGKTVVLAMKAANIHLRYPEKRILFTFHTQSLYNQAKSLISKFHRTYSDTDPDWELLHIRHGWGSKSRPGVYYDICRYEGLVPLTFRQAANIDGEFPFRECCKRALKAGVKESYDYVLVDEAQDFPNEFFKLLYELTSGGKAIYWAYDELQSLSTVDVPTPEHQFGVTRDGKPLVSLDGEYPGNIEKDFVLHRSYRCPREVLMVAHAVGLGIHSPRGCVQMLEHKASWTSIGYEVISGNLVAGEQTSIVRPPDNSPNRIVEIYSGERPLIEVKVFDDREEELDWVCSSIKDDILEDKVRPEHIIVISLDSPKRNLGALQAKLLKVDITSTIPGLIDRSWEFAEPGMVTLSTKFRAKGNEAPVVYVICFEAVYDYAEEIETRNGAFTAISRSKGWVRISGCGRSMQQARKELNKVRSDIPYFNFVFPDMDPLRRLDASETTRRRREVRKAKDSVKALTEVERDALSSLDLTLLKKLKARLDEMEELSDEDQ